jgi:hypothetical protein
MCSKQKTSPKKMVDKETVACLPSRCTLEQLNTKVDFIARLPVHPDTLAII